MKREGLFPVVAEPDVLIIGGSTAAVAMALKLRQRGAKVFLAAPRSYLGDDICAGFRYWPKDAPGKDGLGRGLFHSPGCPPKPLAVKSCLEEALVSAGIPFVLNTHPAGVLRNDHGAVLGALLGNRAGLQAVLAGWTVDGSPEGTLLRQFGVQPLFQWRGKQVLSWTTFLEAEDESPVENLRYTGLPGYILEKGPLHARRFEMEVDFGDGGLGDRARGWVETTLGSWCPGTFQQQSMLLPPHDAATREPTLSDLVVAPGLLALSESLPLPGSANSLLADPLSAIRLSETLGRELPLQPCPANSLETVQVVCGGGPEARSGSIRTLADPFRPGGRGDRMLGVDLSPIPVLSSVDVLIVGGGTGGASAAIAAGRAGASSLVVEMGSALGGVGTLGQICSYWCGHRGGFTKEIDRGVAELETNPRLKEGKGKWSLGAKAHWYLREGARWGVRYLFNTLCPGVWMEENRVSGALVSGPLGFGLIEAKQVIDATGCADLPAAAGAETKAIGKDHVAVQGTGLAAVVPGKYYNNSDHNFSDDTDVVDTTAFLVSTRRKFKGAFDVGELVDSRERRQIVGELTLSVTDILLGRRFPDTVAIATSNFDTHGFTIDPCFMVIPPDKKDLWADVPLRALLPKGLRGTMVTGLGVSAHRDALPVIRMQACVQNQGYAVGCLAARAAQSNQDVRDLDLREIQRHLVEKACLPERVLTDQDTFPVSDKTLEKAIRRDWDQLAGVALVLHEGARSLPWLRMAYADCSVRDQQSLRYAQILALLGDPTGEAELRDSISKTDWDEGWNYRGMGQFGRSMSDLDGRIIAYGGIAAEQGWPVLFEKAAALRGESEFSHFRALSEAMETLHLRHPHPKAGSILARLLDLEGMTGHSIDNLPRFFEVVDASPENNENQVRNLALREIHLARALFRVGDHEEGGAAILRKYAQDLRGHFARHAHAILYEGME